MTKSKQRQKNLKKASRNPKKTTLTRVTGKILDIENKQWQSRKKDPENFTGKNKSSLNKMQRLAKILKDLVKPAP